MKRTLRVALALLLVAAFTLFAMASTEETNTNDQGDGTADVSKSGVSKNEEIGDYSVVIDSCRIAKAQGYQDKDAIIVKYVYTNVGNDTPTSFMTAFDDNAYQDGVGLNTAYFLDDSAKYSMDNQTKEIKKGASIEVEVAYELNDTSTEVEVEVKELFSFNDTVIKKIFTLSE